MRGKQKGQNIVRICEKESESMLTRYWKCLEKINVCKRMCLERKRSVKERTM